MRTRSGPRKPGETAGPAPEGIFAFEADARTIRRSAIHSLLLQVLLRLKGIITLPIITYLMLPEELGVFNLIVSAAGLLAPFLSLNLTDGPVIYFVRERDRGQLSRMYSTVFNTTLLTSGLGLLVLYLIVRAVPSLQDLRTYFLWGVLVYLSLHVFKVTSYILVIYQKTDRMVRYSMWNELSAAVLGLLLVWAGWSYRGLVVGNFIGGVAVGLWILRLLLREVDYLPRIDTGHLKRFVAMSLPLMPVGLFSWVMQSLDAYFLAYFWGAEATGRYAVVYSICRIVLATSMALNFFWYPVSVKMWTERKETYIRAFRILVTHGISILFFLLFLFECNGKLIVFLFARKPEYQTVSPYLSIIAFAFMMEVMITLLTAPLYANENPRWILLSNVIGALLNVALNILLIPRWGLWGASVSTALSYFVVVALLGVGIRGLCRFSFLEARGAAAFGLGLLVWGGLVAVRAHLSGWTGVLASAVLLVIGAPLYYFFFLRSGEREGLRGGVSALVSQASRKRP